MEQLHFQVKPINQGINGLAQKLQALQRRHGVDSEQAVQTLDNIVAEALDPSLESAVDQIIATAKEEVQEPAVNSADIFEFIPVKNNPGRYRLVSPKLRQFIDESMSVGIIEERMLETSSDTPETRAVRKNISVAFLEKFYQSYSDFRDIDQQDIDLSASGLTFDEYQVFYADLKARYEAFIEARRIAAEAAYNAHIATFESGVVDFESLVVGLRREVNAGASYIVNHDLHDVAGRIVGANRREGMFGPFIQITLQVYSHNGEGLNTDHHNITIGFYEGVKSLADLDLEKLDLNSERAKRLIARGEAYLNLTKKPIYVASKGNMTRKQGRSLEIINAVGRVMVDIAGLESIDTNFYGFFCKANEDSAIIPDATIAERGDLLKACCVPFVYGFSFKAKRWGQLNVVDLSPIGFRDDAYEMLVLDQDTKDLIFASVTDQSTDNDIIAGKGGGSINLLEGPPGVGKTLTAEAVAEKLKKPLYMVSAGELGTTVGALESNLKDILEIAESWGAVLLIDEADIFLETRDKADVHRNALVAVFLRLLEYYQGVMFLTTNRADNLDPAFESRITLCIHYTELSYESRYQVWVNLLAAAKMGTTGDKLDIFQLADHKLNGRQIKGIIKSARSLADFNEDELDLYHFEAVIKQKADFKAATVFKLGAGLDNHGIEAAKVATENPGFFQRLYKAVFNVK